MIPKLPGVHRKQVDEWVQEKVFTASKLQTLVSHEREWSVNELRCQIHRHNETRVVFF